MRRLRRIFRLLPATKRCKNCHAPLAGAGAVPMRMIGRHAYEKNPLFCNWCMWACRANPGGTEIEISLIFIDVRGSTALAAEMNAAEFAGLMNRFYDTATSTLVRSDAFIDKLVGDEVIGLYFPGYAGPNHARRAIDAAKELLTALDYQTSKGPWLPVGIGIHTGVAYVGTVEGTEGTVSDFTALGDAVNTTARLVAVARSGEILVSEDAYQAAGLNHSGWPKRTLQLKGKSEPLTVRVKST